MLTLDHLFSDFAPAHSDAMLPLVPVLESSDSSVIVDRDLFRIGTSSRCEFLLSNGPRLHSVIHCEEGVMWIEADDESARLLVNGSPCRRMALRDGDTVTLHDWEAVVRFLPQAVTTAFADHLAEDLAQVSAEELCDRILSEQSAVDEFETGRRYGWQNLMVAIETAGLETAEEDEESDCVALPVGTEATESADDCERLLEQIRELTEMMSGRTQELDSCEDDLATAAALLQETQERVSQQIEELLDQIHVEPESNPLRASA